jgi:hypothetical protein
VLEARKDKFIADNKKIKEQLTALLSEFFIEVESLDFLDQIDPLAVPSMHRFRVYKKVCTQVVAYDFWFSSKPYEFLKVAIIPTMANCIIDRIGARVPV